MKPHLITLILAALLLIGCKPSVPSAYIQPDDMEDLLYDYHIANTMAQEERGEDYAATLADYREAVFRKHGVTKAQFDSSMVYYMRHTDQLHTIYTNLADRLADESRDLGVSVGDNDHTFSATGDTADVWTMARSMVLMPNEPFNLRSFNITADSAYHKGDRILLSFNSSFIFQDGMRDGIAMLSVTFANDSTASRYMHLSTTGRATLELSDADSLGIKEIRGFFMLSPNTDANSSATTLKLMSVSNIHLLRCHPQKQKPGMPGTDSPASQNGTPPSQNDTAPRQARQPLQTDSTKPPINPSHNDQ